MYPYQVWSCGDYDSSLPLTNSDHNVSMEISDEYSVNGNKSFKFVKSNENTAFIMYDCQFSEQKPLTLTGNINTNIRCVIALRLRKDSENITVNSVDISSTGNFEVSVTPTEGYDYVRLFITVYGTTGNIIYLDNLKLST